MNWFKKKETLKIEPRFVSNIQDEPGYYLVDNGNIHGLTLMFNEEKVILFTVFELPSSKDKNFLDKVIRDHKLLKLKELRDQKINEILK